jgi:accessory gene regulator protein AgrB
VILVLAYVYVQLYSCSLHAALKRLCTCTSIITMITTVMSINIDLH